MHYNQRADGELSDPHSRAGITCPVSPAHADGFVMSSVLCHSLQNAGCPLAEETQRRLQFEALLTQLSSRFVNVPANQVDSQIESGLQLIVELLALDRSGLGEVSADGTQFLVTHSYQLPGVPSSSRLLLSSDFPTYASMLRQGLVIRMPEGLPPQATQEREYCRCVGLRAHLAIPLTVMGTVVGGIGFSSFRSERALPDDLIPRLRLVGDIFTNALARKRADESLSVKEQSLRRAKEGLRQLASRLLSAQEEERRRIAREMHDDWTQRLAILGIQTAKLEHHLDSKDVALPLLKTIQQQLVNLSEDVHSLSRQLHPSILEDLGLVEALRSECAGFSHREDISIDYDPGKVPDHVPANIALCLYRVAQEALRNVARHAATDEASVTIGTTGSELVLRVEDRGTGFDPENEHHQPGLGLSSMTERVALVQGQISVTSAFGRGTVVEVRVPLEACTS